MKHFATIFLGILLLTASVKAEEAGSDSIGLSFGVDYVSTYLWRGSYWYSGDGAVFPSISYSIGDLSIAYAGEYSEDKITKKDTDVSNPGIGAFHAADFGMDYSYSIDKTATIGAGVWYFHFYNDDTLSFATGTISIALDMLPLTPTFTYNHDYYTDSKAKKDYYIQLGIGKSYDIKDASVGWGITAGYYNADSTEQKGISDVAVSLNASTTVHGVTFSGSFNWVYVPGKDFYEATIYAGTKDKNRTFASFGASCSI